MDLVATVRAKAQALLTAAPLARDDGLLVAVSGGADSLTLLDVLLDLAPGHGWRLVVATFDHRWQPSGAAAVAAVRDLAAVRGVPIETGVAAPGPRTEAAAREQRHAFLTAAADRAGARWIALGHTADDRLETLLLNLLRGCGTTGLGALGPVNGRLVRPLLEVTRAETTAYAAACGLPVVDDPSNADPTWLRNRVRHEVVPLLEGLRPGASAALRRTAALCGDDRQLLSEVGAAALAARRVSPAPECFLSGLTNVMLDLGGWPATAVAVRRAVLRAAVGELRGHLMDLDYEAVAALDDLAGGRADRGPFQTRGLWAGRVGERLLLLTGPPRGGAWGPVELRGETGRIALPAAGLTLVWGESAGPLTAQVRRGEGAWWARSRRPGDRFRPAGRRTRTVADWLADAGVPAVVRDRVPLVGCGGAVVWVPGVGIAEGWQGAWPVGVVCGPAAEIC